MGLNSSKLFDALLENIYNNFHCRRDGKPVGEISLSHGHAEPVFKTILTSRKSGSVFFTA